MTSVDNPQHSPHTTPIRTAGMTLGLLMASSLLTTTQLAPIHALANTTAQPTNSASTTGTFDTSKITLGDQVTAFKSTDPSCIRTVGNNFFNVCHERQAN
ncbi:hypothetical protein [Secundilactobacillus kimchicus]|uniref:hypothetical protein n=1 Tax=Secundilactobacillus kimchicus TaxID=528209 RepID=UPI0024A9BC1A|nr:hypothetical protein [Secundilactobacillus kimchicus]